MLHESSCTYIQTRDQSFHYRKDGVIKMRNIKGVELKAIIVHENGSKRIYLSLRILLMWAEGVRRGREPQNPLKKMQRVCMQIMGEETQSNIDSIVTSDRILKY